MKQMGQWDLATLGGNARREMREIYEVMAVGTAHLRTTISQLPYPFHSCNVLPYPHTGMGEERTQATQASWRSTPSTLAQAITLVLHSGSNFPVLTTGK
jgi:hypothetical protein